MLLSWLNSFINKNVLSNQTRGDMLVKNMIGRSGNPVANQFIIDCDTDRYFQSYQTIIAKIDINGNIYLDSGAWNYSRTTGKYRNQFLGEGIAETRQKIDAGIYKLVDLN